MTGDAATQINIIWATSKTTSTPHAKQVGHEAFATRDSLLSRNNEPLSKVTSTHQPLVSKFNILSRIASKSLPGNRKLCQTKLELISASKTKFLTNQILRNKTGQSNHTNHPKQCNHFHQLNMTNQAKKRALSQVSADSVVTMQMDQLDHFPILRSKSKEGQCEDALAGMKSLSVAQRRVLLQKAIILNTSISPQVKALSASELHSIEGTFRKYIVEDFNPFQRHWLNLIEITEAPEGSPTRQVTFGVGGNVTPELCGDGVKQLFNHASEFLYSLEREPRAVPNGSDHGNYIRAVVQGTSLTLLYLDKVPIPMQKYSRGLGKWKNAQSSGELDYDTNTTPESTTPQTVSDAKSVAAEEFTTTKTVYCTGCGYKPMDKFSGRQLKNKAKRRRCMECIAEEIPEGTADQIKMLTTRPENLTSSLVNYASMLPPPPSEPRPMAPCPPLTRASLDEDSLPDLIGSSGSEVEFEEYYGSEFTGANCTCLSMLCSSVQKHMNTHMYPGRRWIIISAAIHALLAHAESEEYEEEEESEEEIVQVLRCPCSACVAAAVNDEGFHSLVPRSLLLC
jgi:hypothetical protein